jgi:predicted TIM-barrel fold metal-dependent hydrolase
MRIVDAQIHLWGSGLPSNMAHRQVTSFTTKEALGLVDEAGVDAAVIHPPGWDPNSTTMAFQAVRDFSGRFAILGAFPLNQPDKRALVETWRSQPGMLGLRYGFLAEPMRGWLADGTLDWLWAAAEQAGVPIAVPVHEHAPVPAPDLRRLRAGAHVLGNRHHEDAVLLAAVRDDVHGGAILVARA